MRRDPVTTETRSAANRNGVRPSATPAPDPSLGNAASPTSVLVLMGLFLVVFVIGVVTVVVPELHEDAAASGADASVAASP